MTLYHTRCRVTKLYGHQLRSPYCGCSLLIYQRSRCRKKRTRKQNQGEKPTPIIRKTDPVQKETPGHIKSIDLASIFQVGFDVVMHRTPQTRKKGFWEIEVLSLPRKFWSDSHNASIWLHLLERCRRWTVNEWRWLHNWHLALKRTKCWNVNYLYASLARNVGVQTESIPDATKRGQMQTAS